MWKLFHVPTPKRLRRSKQRPCKSMHNFLQDRTQPWHPLLLWCWNFQWAAVTLPQSCFENAFITNSFPEAIYKFMTTKRDVVRPLIFLLSSWGYHYKIQDFVLNFPAPYVPQDTTIWAVTKNCSTFCHCIGMVSGYAKVTKFDKNKRISKRSMSRKLKIYRFISAFEG